MKDAGPTVHYVFEQLRALACVPAKTGVWSAELRELRDTGVAEAAATWRLSFFPSAGDRIVFKDDFFEGAFSSHKLRVATDLDRDGVDELVLDTSSDHPEGGSGHEYVEVFTVKGGAIAPMQLPFGITQLADKDGDGLLDGIVAETGDHKICQWAFRTMPAPPVVIHWTLETGFAPTDAASRKYARELCPSRPRTIVTKVQRGNQSFVDEAAMVKNAICARLWGAGATDIASEIDRSCRPFVAPDSPGLCDLDKTPPGPDECMFSEATKWRVKGLPVILGGAP